MSRALDRSFILQGLAELNRRDAHRRIFGAIGHQYRLNPPLPASSIEAFERHHGVSLPEDYRLFITEIGNGGAGPSYGVLPFGEDDDGRPWEGDGLVGIVSKPFPHTASWNLPDSFWAGLPDPPPGTPQDEEDTLMEAWDRELEAHYWNPSIMDGAIPICHRGCALRQWLVIRGPQRGFVWDDLRVDNAGIAPVLDESGKPVTFSDWYMGWLDASLRQTCVVQPGDRRLWILVLVQVVLGVVAGLWAPVRLADPLGLARILPPSGLQYVLIAPLFALVRSQAVLMALWVVASASSPWKRLIGMVGGTAWLEGLLLEGRAEMPGAATVAVVVTTVALLLLRGVGVGLVREHPQSRLGASESEGLRFSTRELMAFTAAVAVLSAGARAMQGHHGRFLLLGAVWASCFVAVGLVALWAELGKGGRRWRWPVVLVLSPMLGTFFAHGASFPPSAVFYVILSMLLYPTLLLGSLHVVRSCGYRLVGRAV